MSPLPNTNIVHPDMLHKIDPTETSFYLHRVDLLEEGMLRDEYGGEEVTHPGVFGLQNLPCRISVQGAVGYIGESEQVAGNVVFSSHFIEFNAYYPAINEKHTARDEEQQLYDVELVEQDSATSFTRLRVQVRT